MKTTTMHSINELIKMVGYPIAIKMKRDAKIYLLRAENHTNLHTFLEIAVEREVWKQNEYTDLSKEENLIDSLAFMAAAVELDLENDYITDANK